MKGVIFLIALSVCLSAMTLTKSVTMAAEQETLVYVQDVTIEKVKEGVFRVTARGVVPTPGWKVDLQPLIYIVPPETWVINAIGVKPTGPVPQVETRWEASVQMNLSKETQKISVKGANQTITKPVPW